MKKFISLLLILILLFSMTPIPSEAATVRTAGGRTITVNAVLVDSAGGLV